MKFREKYPILLATIYFKRIRDQVCHTPAQCHKPPKEQFGQLKEERKTAEKNNKKKFVSVKEQNKG